MRILHVLPNGGEGGTQRITARLIAGASEAGHEAAVATSLGAGAGLFGDAAVFAIPVMDRSVSVRALYICIALRGIVRRWRPDVVHAHTARAAVPVSLVTRRGRRPRALVTVHGAPPEAVGTVALALRLAGLPITSDGPGLSARLQERGLRCRTIANGVSPAPPAADRDALRREWSIPAEAHLIVAVGRLVPQKNQMLAVRALPAIPNAVLVVLGEGPLHDELRDEATRLVVSDRLRLVGFRADARAVMAAADAVVMPSVWEGLPLAALEAISAGAPLVATAIPGLEDWLTHGVEALLVPPGSHEALAEALRSVLNDPDMAARLGLRARARAKEYTDESMVDNYLSLYAELV